MHSVTKMTPSNPVKLLLKLHHFFTFYFIFKETFLELFLFQDAELGCKRFQSDSQI